MLVCAFLGRTAHETAGAPCARHLRAPFVLGGAENNGKPRAQHAARMRTHVSSPLPATNAKRLRKGALATKQSTLAARWIVLLTLAMTLIDFLNIESVRPQMSPPATGSAQRAAR